MTTAHSEFYLRSHFRWRLVPACLGVGVGSGGCQQALHRHTRLILSMYHSSYVCHKRAQQYPASHITYNTVSFSFFSRIRTAAHAPHSYSSPAIPSRHQTPVRPSSQLNSQSDPIRSPFSDLNGFCTKIRGSSNSLGPGLVSIELRDLTCWLSRPSLLEKKNEARRS